MRIDTHLHLWDPDAGVYDWLTPEHGPIYARFDADQAQEGLQRNGIDAAVLVQAADSEVDNDSMFAVAAERPWVTGVVAWVDLEAPAEAPAALDRLADGPLCGVRQLIHDDARPGILGWEPVRRTLAEVARRGLALDIPDAFPGHLAEVAPLARELPDLTIVLDHLGKPPRGTDAMVEWGRQFREAAKGDRVVAKVSGLNTPNAPYAVGALRGVWDLALDTFGPQRLMFGSDWPITVAGEGYSGSRDVLGALIGELSPDEQDDIWWRTAERTYRLDLQRFPEPHPT